MGRATKFLLITLLTFSLFAAAEIFSAPPSRQPNGSSPTASTVNPTPQSALIRILTPVAGQKLADNSATVRVELTSQTAYVGAPLYLVQVDGNDPVRTPQTQQTFSGLSPGAHTVTVQLIDANGAPVTGGRAGVQFFVTPAPAQPATSAKVQGGKSPEKRELRFVGFKFQRPDPAQDQDEANLPPASSPLPLISIVGFGVLVGGIVSAMKTRS
jgi:hypothetical protein